ncbi:integrin beta-like protein a, partial [Plakobranchus ocellatus]
MGRFVVDGLYLLMVSLLVICCQHQHKVFASKNFLGGSLSYEYYKYDKGFHTVRITAVTGWDLSNSPCGQPCVAGDIGKSTKDWRDYKIRSTGSATNFGEWHLEIKTLSGTIREGNITGAVNTMISGEVAYVSASQPRWMQEVAFFFLEVEDSQYVDVIFKGQSWTDLDMQDCMTYNSCHFYLQQKLRFGTRNDTGAPNNSPKMLYGAVNRIEPNQQSEIEITVMDDDGDLVVCKKADYVLISFPQIDSLSVDDNCVVTVDSSGFPEGSRGMVNVVIEDKPRSSITMGGKLYEKDGTSSLSQVQVQFLVEVAKALPPEIVAPTPCSRGLGNAPPISVNATDTLRIPLYARPNPNSQSSTTIVDFKVTILPTPTTRLVLDNSPTKSAIDNVWTSGLLFETKPPPDDKTESEFLLHVFARDSLGYDSEACRFQVRVLALVTTHAQNPCPPGSTGNLCQSAKDSKCHCENGGHCGESQTQKKEVCYCPLGFFGDDCSSADTDPRPKRPTFDDAAGIPNGGTILCEEFSDCIFNIHTIGRDPGQPPTLKEAPKSPELKIRFDATKPETSTSLAGNRFVTSAVIKTGPPGLFKLCVNSEDASRTRITATYCYHVKVVPKTMGSKVQFQTAFIPPTPPNGTEIPCPKASERCYLLAYTKTLPTGTCPKLVSENEAKAFVVTHTPAVDVKDACVAQIMLFNLKGLACVHVHSMPQQSSSSGEKDRRCYTVTPVDETASRICRSEDCNQPIGACLATPDIPSTQCVCPEHAANYLDVRCYQ